MLMTASRTIDAVPGIKSAAFTHFVSVKLVGSEKSRISSIVPGATVCSASIGILRSGGPSFHCGLKVTAGSFASRSPSRRSAGRPDDDHVDVARTDRVPVFDRRAGWIDRPRRHAARSKLVADRFGPRHRVIVGHQRHRRRPALDVADGAVIPQQRENIPVVVVFRRHRFVRVGVLAGDHEEESARKREDDARSDRAARIVYRVP